MLCSENHAAWPVRRPLTMPPTMTTMMRCHPSNISLIPTRTTLMTPRCLAWRACRILASLMTMTMTMTMCRSWTRLGSAGIAMGNSGHGKGICSALGVMELVPPTTPRTDVDINVALVVAVVVRIGTTQPLAELLDQLRHPLGMGMRVRM